MFEKIISEICADHFFFSRAYWGFADHFKHEADLLLNSLDGTYRRLLQAGGHAGNGGDISNSSSSNSLNMAGRGGGSTMPR